MTGLRLDGAQRQALWQEVLDQITRFKDQVRQAAVAPHLRPQLIRTLLANKFGMDLDDKVERRATGAPRLYHQFPDRGA